MTERNKFENSKTQNINLLTDFGFNINHPRQFQDIGAEKQRQIHTACYAERRR